MQSQATRVSLPPSTRRMDDHGEWAGVPPTLKACRSRQRAPGRTGTVGVRRGWGGVGAPLPCWAGKLGALTAIFTTISNNDCVPTDATRVRGVSSGCVVPAPFSLQPLTGLAQYPWSQPQAFTPHSPSVQTSSPSPPTAASPGLPLPTGPHLSFQPRLLPPAAPLQVAGASNSLFPLPGIPFPLPSGRWPRRKVTLRDPPLCSQLCCHARHTLGALLVPAELQKPWPWRKPMDFTNLLPLCKRFVAEPMYIVQLKQQQETEPKQVSRQP